MAKIDTPDDVADDMADRIGIYGANRSIFVADLTVRIQESVANENQLHGKKTPTHNEYKQMLDLILTKVKEIIFDMESSKTINIVSVVTGLIQIENEIESCGTRPMIVLKKHI